MSQGFVVIDGRYAVESQLGSGGMGVVYLAKDLGLNRSVAVKCIAPEHAVSPDNLARFRREAQVLASLRNDNVVQVHACGRHEDSFYFVMEYVAGPTLDVLIDTNNRVGTPVSFARALEIVRKISNGLEAVHARGLVHRDVKPANVVLEEESGRPVLVDFGVALETSGTSPSEALIAGTPLYMAPEQIEPTGRVTARTDQYALACTAFELLAGRPPFDYPSDAGTSIHRLLHEHLNQTPPLLSDFRADLASLDAVFARALSKDAEARFGTCRAFVDALEQAEAEAQRAAALPAAPVAAAVPSVRPAFASEPGTFEPHVRSMPAPSPTVASRVENLGAGRWARGRVLGAVSFAGAVAAVAWLALAAPWSDAGVAVHASARAVTARSAPRAGVLGAYARAGGDASSPDLGPAVRDAVARRPPPVARRVVASTTAPAATAAAAPAAAPASARGAASGFDAFGMRK